MLDHNDLEDLRLSNYTELFSVWLRFPIELYWSEFLKVFQAHKDFNPSSYSGHLASNRFATPSGIYA